MPQSLRWKIALLALILLCFTVPWSVNAATGAKPQNHKKAGSKDDSRLSAHSALIIDRETGSVLYEKNGRDPQPIASITKLMVAIIVLESSVDLNETVVLNKDDDRPSRGRHKSRLRVGSPVTRDELLKLMLMSSENKAAYALARSHPEGLNDFIRAMNEKAENLGMQDTKFADPTGLSDENVSTAWDLITLLRESERYPIIKDYSIKPNHKIAMGRAKLNYVNSNRLVREGGWEIELQKTGTTTKAGKCLVMLANLGGRPVEMVLLRARGKLGRVRDAKLIKAWIETDLIASAVEFDAEVR